MVVANHLPEGSLMNVKGIVGYGIFPGLLLLTGFLVDRGQLWSSGANWTIPWLCSALALALLVVGATSLICDQPAASLAPSTVFLVYLVVVVVAGVGIVLDGWKRPDVDAFLVSIAEWIGFSAILLVLFSAPRRKADSAASRESQPPAV